jgi:crossover junction endodeoxyribonuclease RusA
MAALSVTLPWPPTVNTYWRYTGSRPLISQKGRAYRKAVKAAMLLARVKPITGRLKVVVRAHPPDQRRRDLDNILKAPLDAMQHAGLYEDDSQIDRLTIERAPLEKEGRLVVGIEQI